MVEYPGVGEMSSLCPGGHHGWRGFRGKSWLMKGLGWSWRFVLFCVLPLSSCVPVDNRGLVQWDEDWCRVATRLSTRRDWNSRGASIEGPREPGLRSPVTLGRGGK